MNISVTYNEKTGYAEIWSKAERSVTEAICKAFVTINYVCTIKKIDLHQPSLSWVPAIGPWKVKVTGVIMTTSTNH